MKFFENQCFFDYAWEQVSSAHWRKYPNEQASHVVAVDTLRSEVDPNTGILRIERLITCRQGAPRWIVKLVGSTEDSYVREVSEVDLKNRTLTLLSTNLTFSNILSVQETVSYTPDVNQPHARTRFTQDAKITAYGALSRWANNMMEDFTIDRFKQNAARGRAGFESVLEHLHQGVFERATQKTSV
ncbi:Phospholipid metabolism protein [Savitreella phatthalungensis]